MYNRMGCTCLCCAPPSPPRLLLSCHDKRESRALKERLNSLAFLPSAVQIEEAVAGKRKEVFTLFKSIAKISLSETTAFVATRLEAVIANTQASFQEVEIVVTLFYQLGEGAAEEYTKPGCGILGQMAAGLMQAQLPHARHRLVAVAVLEVFVRYCRVVQTQPSLAPAVLGALLDDRGMGHSSEAVSTKACYLFQRLVRQLRSSFAPVVETVLAGLEPHLSWIASSPVAQAPSASPGGPVLGGPKGTQGKGPMGAASYLDDRMYAFEVRGPYRPREAGGWGQQQSPEWMSHTPRSVALFQPASALPNFVCRSLHRLLDFFWVATTSRRSGSRPLCRGCWPLWCSRSRATPMLPPMAARQRVRWSSMRSSQ